jgi:dihydropyrimidine dehydrogenase (NAD+) subunit PreA
MSSLSIELLGLQPPNPFFLLAEPAACGAQETIGAFEAGWGGVVLQADARPPRRATQQRRQVIRSGARRWGLVEMDPCPQLSALELAEELRIIRHSIPSAPILVNIVGGKQKDQWVEAARVLVEAGSDGLVIPGGGPNPFAPQGGWAELAGDASALARVISWLRGETAVPIIAELSPNVTDILPIARAAIDAGADGLIATSGLAACGGVDFETLLPLPSEDPDRLVGSYTGLGLKPVAQRWTAKLASEVDIPIIGRGGVGAWEDAVEYLAIGASALIVGAAAGWHGIGIIDDLTSGLRDYLQGKDLGGPMEIRARALPSIVGFDELDLDIQMVALVDQEHCTGCEVCVRACEDGGYQALKMVGGVASADRRRCDGCGLCVYVCPEFAIQLIRKSGPEPA